uniref:Uncharacterized protein n=1 Tax=Meloidogyne enterolobii TaxID=390850 RepID=A0A6V7X2B2_MELEN|nr:unnamed protein product [Meloidogyne enterolobii]
MWKSPKWEGRTRIEISKNLDLDNRDFLSRSRPGPGSIMWLSAHIFLSSISLFKHLTHGG